MKKALYIIFSFLSITLITNAQLPTANEKGIKYADSLSKLATYFNYEGDFQKSMDLNKECLAIREKLFGKEHPGYAEILNNLATNYSYLGNYKKSLMLNKECLVLRERIFGREHPDYASSLINLARDYSILGQYDMSLQLNKECLALLERIYGKEHTNYAWILSYLANDYFYLGQYGKSLELNKECLALTEKIYGKENSNYANWLNNLSLAYSYLGQYEKSLELNKECLALRERIHGKEHPYYANSLNNLALAYSDMAQYEKSLELNKECLALRERIFGKEHPYYANSLGNLALAYSDMGQYEKSLELNKECLALKERIFGNEHPDYATSLNNLAGNFSELGQYEKSLELNKECLALTEKIYGREHPDYATSLNNLARVYGDLGDFISFDTLFVQHYKISERLYTKNKNGLSEKEKEQFIKELKSDFEYLTNYVLLRKAEKPELSAEISSAILNLKGALLSTNQHIKDEVFSSGDTSLINLYEQWETGKLQLGKYYEKTLQELADNGVDLKAEEERVNALEQELSRKSLEFKESQKSYTWQDVKNKLNADEAYVELIRTDHYDFENDRPTDTVHYAALIIDNTNDYPELVVLENGVQLEEAAYRYYTSHTAGKNKQYIDEFSYQNYWFDIAEKLKGKKRVYLSSDGVYNKLNLNVLYNKETGKYLAEELDIRLVTSGRDLFKTYPKTENKELTAVLVGSPTYDLIQEQAQEKEFLVSRDLQQYWIDSLSRGWSVSALPGTAIEVSNISDLMTANKWKVTTYTDKQAIEGKVKSVSSPTVLHLATHGYFFEDVAQEKESPTRIMGVDTKKATQNPLLRSGLLFAGAKNTLNGKEPKSGDNGLLTAYEASYMHLKGTELVVLSACETAKGEIKNGEGVYGLQRAIQQAGAQNIIMSMWKVDDKVTQEFMSLFYKTWLAGSTKREAFNSTQEQIKETYKHPYYWGAFVMIGR